MLTNLHRKIKSMCVFPRKGPAHWILVGCRTSWISEIQEIVSTRRAAYAAFRGEVPEGMDVRSNCGVVPCICPDHAILTESRYCARALSLPGQLAALARPDAFCPPDQSGILPRGLTLALVELVKFLSREKNTLAQIATATGLARREIVAIRGGKRDAAATTLRGALASRRGFKDHRTARHPSEISDDSLPPRAAVEPGPGPIMPEDVAVSEEEAAWLGQVGR